MKVELFLDELEVLEELLTEEIQDTEVAIEEGLFTGDKERFKTLRNLKEKLFRKDQ